MAFLEEIKKRIYKPVVDATATVISAPSRAITKMKGRAAQDKMISEYVTRQPSNIPTHKRTDAARANENEYLDRKIKKNLKSKGIY